jgi:hypothetical protein
MATSQTTPTMPAASNAAPKTKLRASAAAFVFEPSHDSRYYMNGAG